MIHCHTCITEEEFIRQTDQEHAVPHKPDYGLKILCDEKLHGHVQEQLSNNSGILKYNDNQMFDWKKIPCQKPGNGINCAYEGGLATMRRIFD